MNQIDEHGGPAFPSSAMLTGAVRVQYKGMTLRDYFAAQALPALINEPVPANASMLAYDLAGRATCKYDELADMYAQSAYKLADAMLRARDAQR